MLTKDVSQPEDPSIEIKFNKWTEDNPENTVHAVQFFQFNKISPDNSVEKQLMCCSILYFPKSA
jgi:hypothetical protein